MKWKVTALLVLIALPGVVATSWLALPLLVDVSKITVPLEILQIATAVQSTVLVTVAALIGATVAQKVGLSTPTISALASGGKVFEALRPQLLPGLIGGCIGAAIIVCFYALLPESLRSVQLEAPLPLVVRVLYGGITEEVLVRWGLMTLIAWIGWKVLQRKLPRPTQSVMVAAIVLSSLVFGLSHVPSVAQLLPELLLSVVAYITIGNALFGLVAGYLFWSYGLEAAIVAHVSAHLLAFIIHG
ncbi:CPBP family intramembrane glutamic endopeptidase [Synechocystis sp. PCC 6714]|uniref:CPBP family intramembrane glutamic endopeptidase n=1 Tax=Synechocystis sp. (strain PCC 6714) TaxID=1147 RepID=UPI000408E9B7|nr:CPBP family intramembrane glutamic endopeptidase [Synechocystis sp. PCC 6714]AIE76053.1 hypothetical protein D082_40070 [Synechocystis sp. PCC 6714]